MPTKIRIHKRHLRIGALYGWCLYCPTAERRRSLEIGIRRDGLKEIKRRLVFLANMLKNNKHVETIKEDLRWLEAQ